jgi:hypothetical protein
MKRTIQNKQEANKYYDIVNKAIDEYIEENNIRPSRLRKYMSAPKKESLLKRKGLSDVEGIDRVLDDVLDDRFAMESDKVIKFESFRINESKESGHERAAAEFFRASLDQVVKSADGGHNYEVEDIGEHKGISVYSSEDVKEFRTKLITTLKKLANEEEIDIHRADLGLASKRHIRTKIKVSLGQVLNQEKLNQVLEESLSEKKTIEILGDYLNEYEITKARKGYKYKGKQKIDGEVYHIWQLESR